MPSGWSSCCFPSTPQGNNCIRISTDWRGDSKIVRPGSQQENKQLYQHRPQIARMRCQPTNKRHPFQYTRHCSSTLSLVLAALGPSPCNSTLQQRPQHPAGAPCNTETWPAEATCNSALQQSRSAAAQQHPAQLRASACRSYLQQHPATAPSTLHNSTLRQQHPATAPGRNSESHPPLLCLKLEPLQLSAIWKKTSL